MIHVSISLEYRGIPFSIEIDGQTTTCLEVATLGVLLVRIRAFIDKMLDAKQ